MSNFPFIPIIVFKFSLIFFKRPFDGFFYKCLAFFFLILTFTDCASSSVYTSSPPSFTWPVKTKKVTQKFKTFKKHEGIDLSGSRNTPVYATAAGKVIYAGQRFSGYGKLVIIEHRGDQWASFYAHLNRFKVRAGQSVKSGQLIGLMGNTGRASGVHLHFEIRHNLKPVDPLIFLSQ